MKKIAFLTGTRADFGKIKSLLIALEKHPDFEVFLFVTGMHLMEEYGYTLVEVKRSGIKNIETFSNYTSENTMELTLAQTIVGFSAFVRKIAPDMVVIHGDRVEALAGAIVGSLTNTLVGHIEGGELSGTIDDLIRHSVSKLSHIHFVANEQAKKRLVQMGEEDSVIQVIGSPDIDVMRSGLLPSIEEAKDYYNVNFDQYAIGLFHPVTTEAELTKQHVMAYVAALRASTLNYLLIYPNNDLGSKLIIEALLPLADEPRFRLLPSLRFEYFLTFLKKASFIIGNSSAGIREAPYFGVPTVNIGSRQNNRSSYSSIVHTSNKTEDILAAIDQSLSLKAEPLNEDFGAGDSTELFLDYMLSDKPWQTATQKTFIDL